MSTEIGIVEQAVDGFDPGVARRIEMTCRCRDCDDIPKGPGAGEVFTDAAGRWQRMHNGVKIAENCYCGAWMTEVIRRLRGHHEPQEERAFHEVVRHASPGSMMVELGAYWSYYSLWFRAAVSGARSLLVEPDPNHLGVGRQNFAANGVEGEFVQAAIGREPRPPEAFACESDGILRPVATVSVDALLRDRGIDRVELLLADIQGAEVEMLSGAEQSFAEGKIRFLFVSTHHHVISGDPLTHQKCLAFLRERGGHVLAEHPISESFSGDGLIVVSFAAEDRSLPTICLSRNEPGRSLFRETEYDLAEALDRLRDVEARLAAAERAAPQPVRPPVGRTGHWLSRQRRGE
jgi:FkbM family methyltransferase